MSPPVVAREAGHPAAEPGGYVAFRLGGEWLGVPVGRVQEVLSPQWICPVPLAPPEVAGLVNLRGRIVTVVDLRCRLGLPAREERSAGMHIVVRDGDELFSLLVDTVGDVVEAERSRLEPVPSTAEARWRECCDGVVRLSWGLLVAVSIDRLLGAAAAPKGLGVA